MSCDNRRLVNNVVARGFADPFKIMDFHRLGVRNAPKLELTPSPSAPADLSSAPDKSTGIAMAYSEKPHCLKNV